MCSFILLIKMRSFIKFKQLSVAGDSSQNTATTPTVTTDDQALETLQVSHQAAQVAIQQLQGHGITLASDQDGQQIYVVADPAQLQALQVV